MLQTERSAERVLVVVNKWWECDPIVSALLHPDVQPSGAHVWPSDLHHPRKRPDPKEVLVQATIQRPRALFSLKHASIEIWCVSDLLEHYPDEPRYQSSSQRKAEQLGKIFRGREPILVVAVGTTAFPSHQSQNGNVVIGTKVFMHNTHPNGENPDSSWDVGPFDTVVDSRLSRDAFDMIVADLTPGVESHFLSPPLNPAPKKALLVSYDYASLGTLNVTRSDEYERVDALTLAAYTVANETESAKSVETTFGLIRVQIDAPFLFVGGVVNRLGHFGEEVRPRKYAQNMVGGHNVGVALAWMLRSIDCAAGRQLTVQAS